MEEKKRKTMLNGLIKADKISHDSGGNFEYYSLIFSKIPFEYRTNWAKKKLKEMGYSTLIINEFLVEQARTDIKKNG